MASFCDIIILLPKYVSIVLSCLPFLELEKKKKKKLCSIFTVKFYSLVETTLMMMMMMMIFVFINVI